MCDLIEHECAKAERDLLAACRQSLAHGALLATRYALEEIDFTKNTTTTTTTTATQATPRVAPLLGASFRLPRRVCCG